MAIKTASKNVTTPTQEVSLSSFSAVEQAFIGMALNRTCGYLLSDGGKFTRSEIVEMVLDADRLFTIGMQGDKQHAELYARWCKLSIQAQDEFAYQALFKRR